MFIQPQGKQIAAWLTRLVQIPSVSPDQAGPRAGTPGEGLLASKVAQWFQELGADVHQDEALPGRPNVFGLWRGRSDNWLGVDIHLDTVSVEQMAGDPFSGAVANGRVYGRGAVDTKASLAIVLALLEEAQRSGQQPAANVLIAATVDEEVGALGAPASARWIEHHGIYIDQLIVAEPTRCVPIHGHRGVVRIEFAIRGKAAHSSQPHQGKNAIIAGAQLINALQAEHERLQTLPPAALDRAALTVTLVQGGTGVNVVPDSCRVSLDRRVVDGERASMVVASLHTLAQTVCPLPLEMRIQKEIDAFYQPADSPFIQGLVEWSGHPPATAPYGTNAWAYAQVANERVVFGPGSIEQAHGAEEWVEIDQLEQAAAVYARWWGL